MVVLNGHGYLPPLVGRLLLTTQRTRDHHHGHGITGAIVSGVESPRMSWVHDGDRVGLSAPDVS